MTYHGTLSHVTFFSRLAPSVVPDVSYYSNRCLPLPTQKEGKPILLKTHTREGEYLSTRALPTPKNEFYIWLLVLSLPLYLTLLISYSFLFFYLLFSAFLLNWITINQIAFWFQFKKKFFPKSLPPTKHQKIQKQLQKSIKSKHFPFHPTSLVTLMSSQVFPRKKNLTNF